MTNKRKWLSIAKSFGMITLASAIYAFAYNMFYAPNDIAFGGVTGIGQMVNRLLGWPSVGVFIIVVNIPLFLLAWRFLGNKMLLGSLYAMALSSILLDLFGTLFTFPVLEEPLMACVFGGVVLGSSVGLIAREGSSMGGTDIAARLLKLKFPTVSVGQMMRVLDFTVIAGVSIVFQQLNSALMGIMALFISTYCVDKVLFGTDPSKVAYIISNKPDEIARAIITDLHRGVTLLHGAGGWTKAEKNVLLCAFKSRQIVELKRMIKELDPEAFLIVCEAYEVLGDGFLPHDPKKKGGPKPPPPMPIAGPDGPEADDGPEETEIACDLGGPCGPFVPSETENAKENTEDA